MCILKTLSFAGMLMLIPSISCAGTDIGKLAGNWYIVDWRGHTLVEDGKESEIMDLSIEKQVDEFRRLQEKPICTTPYGYPLMVLDNKGHGRLFYQSVQTSHIQSDLINITEGTIPISVELSKQIYATTLDASGLRKIGLPANTEQKFIVHGDDLLELGYGGTTLLAKSPDIPKKKCR